MPKLQKHRYVDRLWRYLCVLANSCTTRGAAVCQAKSARRLLFTLTTTTGRTVGKTRRKPASEQTRVDAVALQSADAPRADCDVERCQPVSVSVARPSDRWRKSCQVSFDLCIAVSVRAVLQQCAGCSSRRPPSMRAKRNPRDRSYLLFIPLQPATALRGRSHEAPSARP